MRLIIFMCTAMLAAGCSDQPTENAAANAAVAATPEKVPHCFFKDSETKGWAAKPKDGQVVVTGSAFRSDARYKAVLLDPVISERVAIVRPSITTNDTGFAAEGNWWDVTASIPAEGLDKIEVRCGKKLVATLALAKKEG